MSDLELDANGDLILTHRTRWSEAEPMPIAEMRSIMRNLRRITGSRPECIPVRASFYRAHRRRQQAAALFDALWPP